MQSGIDTTSEEFGQIHICCNFAGVADAARTVGKQGPFPLDQFRKVIDINLIGTFNVMRLAAVKMAANQLISEESGRGVIINTASVAAFEGQMGQAAYSASQSRRCRSDPASCPGSCQPENTLQYHYAWPDQNPYV